jgi:hypothetical protein
MSAAKAFTELLAHRLAAQGKRWETTRGFDATDFAAAFASAGRLVGKGPLISDPEQEAALRVGGLEWSIAGWSLEDAARASLLLGACAQLSAAEHVQLTAETFRQGDTREKVAILRALPLLPEPALHLPLAIDACRTSVQPVFEAIACENPFPAEHFPELNFNQLVLKAVFIEVALKRIVGLDSRLSAELGRMAKDYAQERTAAGRSVPADLALLTA